MFKWNILNIYIIFLLLFYITMSEILLKPYTVDSTDEILNKDYTDKQDKPLNKLLINFVNFSWEFLNNKNEVVAYTWEKYVLTNFKLEFNNWLTEIKKIIKDNSNWTSYTINDSTSVSLTKEQFQDILSWFSITDSTIYIDYSTKSDVLYKKEYFNDNNYPTNSIHISKTKDNNFEITNFKLKRNNWLVEIDKKVVIDKDWKKSIINNCSTLILSESQISDILSSVYL